MASNIWYKLYLRLVYRNLNGKIWRACVHTDRRTDSLKRLSILGFNIDPEHEYMWQRWVLSPDGLSNSRWTGNDIDEKEEEQRVLVDDAKSEYVKEQG